jgi:hypothetical protein
MEKSSRQFFLALKLLAAKRGFTTKSAFVLSFAERFG